jgi:DNA polymerase elongation subunit (family B)
MSRYVYDVEVFPNFFSATFIDIVNRGDVSQFYIFEGKGKRAPLLNLLRSADQLVGFNSLSYDDPMLLTYMDNVRSEHLNRALFKTSGALIKDYPAVKKLRWADRNWKSVDLMRIMAFDKIGVSLKQAAITMGWSRIKELDYDWRRPIKEEWIEEILDYNKNDAMITLALHDEIREERLLREQVSKTYGVNVISASRSRMGSVLLEKFYTEKNDISPKELRNQGTHYESIKLKDCIPKDVVFNSPELVKLLKKLKGLTLLKENQFKYAETFTVDDVTYHIGVGGMHSQDAPLKLIPADTMVLRDADVASYYPAIMLKNKIYPAHLNPNIMEIVETIRAERLEAKKAGEKTKAEALKITINAIVGKFGNDDYWLADMKAFLSVTIAGQLYLLMLIEQLQAEGIEIKSANTDGVLTFFPLEWMDRFEKVCANWREQLGFELEYTDYNLYMRRDVNNYLARSVDGKIKEKGALSTERNLQKSYNQPIVAKAIRAYIIDGIPVQQTVRSSQNILDFCISQKTGDKFKTEYHTIAGIQVLQKNNRYYAAETGGGLAKRHQETGATTGLLVGQNVRILNDFDPFTPIAEYKVDYEYYEKQIYATIDLVEAPFAQLEMF